MNNNIPEPKNQPAQKSHLKLYVIILILLAVLFFAIEKKDSLKKILFPAKVTKTSNINEKPEQIDILISKITTYQADLQNTQSQLENLSKIGEQLNKLSVAQNTKTAVNIISLYKLLDKLQTSDDFSSQLDMLLMLDIDNNIKLLLKQLKPYEKNNILTVAELQNAYPAISQQIYLNYTYNNSSKIKYWLLKLFFVTNQNFAQYPFTDIRYGLGNANALLKNNKLQPAYDELKQTLEQNSIINNATISTWLEQFAARLVIEQINVSLKNEISTIYTK